ncbi:MAG: adenylyl-sulfate kinase [Pseudomonadota bacterium]|jgi:adenylyl-sulfate kinase
MTITPAPQPSAALASSDIVWQNYQIDRSLRAAMKRQRPAVLWFTGLSGAGKSTIANLLEQRLAQLGSHTYLLDGDNVRHGLCRDLGFSPEARTENIRRVGEVAKLMADAGLLVLTAFISPFRSDRDMVRQIMPPGEFIEIFVDTPLAECERRDTKGLYKKARRGELKHFTGIDSPYEAPATPEIRLDTLTMSEQQCVEHIIGFLQRGFLLRDQ